MMQAIETRYNGYKFRSRIEARWAVFFDALGIEYHYEPQGYNLGEAGYYLPDFYLLRVELWAEIKPCEPTGEEIRKITALARESGHRGVILWGDIPRSNAKLKQEKRWKVYGERCRCSDVFHYGTCEHYDICRWAICSHCKTTDLTPWGSPAFLHCPCFEEECGEWLTHDPIDMRDAYEGETDVESVDEAYEAARSARFEHGDIPDVSPIIQQPPKDAYTTAECAICEKLIWIRNGDRAMEQWPCCTGCKAFYDDMVARA